MTIVQFLWREYLQITNPSCIIRAASLSRNVHLEKRVTIEYGSHILCSHIGKYTYINKYCLLDKNTLSIGRFCSIAYNVRIGLGSHPDNWVSTHAFAYDKKYGFNPVNNQYIDNKKTVIGNDVWIGANATILAGVHVGNGAIIGAHSLVTKDVDAYAVVVGTPAKQIRYRFSNEIINKLQKIKWWNWDEKKIKKHLFLFSDASKLLASLEK